MNPEAVNPRNFRVERIVYNSPDGFFSVAIGVWTEDEMNRLAMRWNGDRNNQNDIGYPSLGGNPVWFQLPYEDIRGLAEALIENEPI